VTPGVIRMLLAAALASGASVAVARTPGTSADGVLRFPSADLPSLVALQNAVQNPAVRTVVLDAGHYQVGSGLFVAARDDLVICGATGDPKDVVLETSVGAVVSIQAARHVTLRGLTLESTASFGSAVYLVAAPTTSRESYVEDVVVDRCVLRGYIGVQATVRVRDLAVNRSRIVLTGSGAQHQGGVGILWEDGPGLLVGRTRFTVEDDVAAVAGVLVRGAQSGASEGDRARRVLLVGNDVAGDFARGFQLADVVDAVVRGNRVSFPSPVVAAALPGVAAGAGRVGVIVLRANASAQTEQFQLVGNRVRGGFYGAWLVNTGTCSLRRNDFRANGATDMDADFGDHGGALRMNMQSGECGASIESNDFRRLRSPISEPAVVVVPKGADPSDCFSAARPNRVDSGRKPYDLP
jgi:hypothetical protein